VAFVAASLAACRDRCGRRHAYRVVERGPRRNDKWEGMMPTTTPLPPPTPDINVPLVDPATGRMTTEWYRWLAFWVRILTQVRKEIP
jgi:hypothetical protein